MITSEVFGINNNISEHSYIDRGNLDEVLVTYLKRDTHIAIKGASKSGKTWLRKRAIPSAITIQCRYNTTVNEIYKDILSQLNIKLEIKTTKSLDNENNIKASIKGQLPLIFDAGIEGTHSITDTSTTETHNAGSDINDLRFIAKQIENSKKRLVIEDFHYLPVKERELFASDLKALYDYGIFVVIIGVWSSSNFIQELNSDLTGRIHELSIDWSKDDLKRIINKGCSKLNLEFTNEIQEELASLAYGNAGILQKLTLETLDKAGIHQTPFLKGIVSDISFLESAAMFYADQINPIYMDFAKRVSAGIRYRKNSTGIYAHTLDAILKSSDEELTRGLSAQILFERAHEKQPRIQAQNLKRILDKIDDLQVDNEGRGKIISYNSRNSEITIVDRQLLLYRKFRTIDWPWDKIIEEADINGGQLEVE